jgi:hypothetical protein
VRCNYIYRGAERLHLTGLSLYIHSFNAGVFSVNIPHEIPQILLGLHRSGTYGHICSPSQFHFSKVQ